jgi:hypothetical protein
MGATIRLLQFDSSCALSLCADDLAAIFVFVVFARVDEQFCVSYENIRPSFFSGNCGTKFAKIYWENHRTLVVRLAKRDAYWSRVPHPQNNRDQRPRLQWRAL